MGRKQRLSEKQAALVDRLRGNRVLVPNHTPGKEWEPPKWYIENPYSEEDGRVVNSLLSRGLLRNEGGIFSLDEAALSATPLEPSEQKP